MILYNFGVLLSDIRYSVTVWYGPYRFPAYNILCEGLLNVFGIP